MTKGNLTRRYCCLSTWNRDCSASVNSTCTVAYEHVASNRTHRQIHVQYNIILLIPIQGNYVVLTLNTYIAQSSIINTSQAPSPIKHTKISYGAVIQYIKRLDITCKKDNILIEHSVFWYYNVKGIAHDLYGSDITYQYCYE